MPQKRRKLVTPWSARTLTPDDTFPRAVPAGKQVEIHWPGKALTAEGYTFCDVQYGWVTCEKVHFFASEDPSGYTSVLYCRRATRRAAAEAHARERRH